MATNKHIPTFFDSALVLSTSWEEMAAIVTSFFSSALGKESDQEPDGNFSGIAKFNPGTSV